MHVWEADFYRRPFQDQLGHPLWELMVCDPMRTFSFSAMCTQSEANATWLASQLQQAAGSDKNLPERVQVFRPQCLSLMEVACQSLKIGVEPTRRTFALKQWLQERYAQGGAELAQQYPDIQYTGQFYQPLELEKLPPLPLPEQLWGEQWRFASLPAAQIEEAFLNRPIPILEMPKTLLPLHLGLASTLPVPGVVIDGGRQSMRLARWLQAASPVALSYIPGAPDGLILEAGLADRWVVATFEDPEVAAAAQIYEQRKQLSQGLHFLLVQPDNSGMTYSGFWLLQM
jgi:hypothetical protein